MNEQLTLNTKDGMEYEQHGSVAAAVASCIFKALANNEKITF